MDHERWKALLSAHAEGGLDPEERRRLEEHLAACAECRGELAELERFEEVMGRMKLKNPPDAVWQVYWSSVYNRLERGIGWILLSLGAIALLLFGGFKAIEGILRAPGLSPILRGGILLAMAGSVVLIVSVLRERLYARKRERYEEIER